MFPRDWSIVFSGPKVEFCSDVAELALQWRQKASETYGIPYHIRLVRRVIRPQPGDMVSQLRDDRAKARYVIVDNRGVAYSEVAWNFFSTYSPTTYGRAAALKVAARLEGFFPEGIRVLKVGPKLKTVLCGDQLRALGLM